MKILVAPLNWGLGHASRCIPLITRYMQEGHEVVLGGDGDSGVLLRKTFPHLRFLPLAPLHLQYDAANNQHRFMARAIPILIRFTLADHRMLREYLIREHFDLVVSDNRFGLFSPYTRCEYITHQLYPQLPSGWRVWQPLAHALHAAFYRRYDACLIPDYADAHHNLSGKLSHGKKLPQNARFIGPLSRFTLPTEPIDALPTYDIVAVLSGLEPQRTLLEQHLIAQYEHSPQSILIVRGKVAEPALQTQHQSITLVNTLSTAQLKYHLQHASTIIARSGYSTIMDLDALQVLDKAQLYPTPGQSEQEYLYSITKTTKTTNL